jgi:hypothetical protein
MNDIVINRRGPTIILVEPQLGENIGMVARAMLNCGLTDLRLVAPRDGWPSAKAGFIKKPKTPLPISTPCTPRQHVSVT